MLRVFDIRKVATAAMLLGFVGCSSTRYERTTGEFVDDKMLGRRVEAALNQQPVYKFPDVHVHTFRGVVQLSGFVVKEEQKAAAGEIAQHVRGVSEVRNAISLVPLAYNPGRDPGTNRLSTGAPGRGTATAIGTATNGADVRVNN